MNKVQVNAVDMQLVVGESVDICFSLSPVILMLPIACQLLNSMTILLLLNCIDNARA